MNHLSLPSICLSLALAAATCRADVVLDWNTNASDTVVANWALQNPGMASRTMAMVNLAMYDAFQMTSPAGTMFYDYGAGHASPNYDASPQAAAAVGAYSVLSSVYPDQQSLLDSRLAASLAAIPDGPQKTAGVALGGFIGDAIARHRANDGFDDSSAYTPSGAPGGWSPDPLNPGQQAWGPQWGQMQTFLTPRDAIAVPAPPALDSPEYATAFDEVKSLGAIDSTTRTAEQTEIGVFWGYDRLGTGSPPVLYNEILRKLGAQQGNSEKQNAELFAKATVAMADAGVLAWDTKFAHDLWRPVTAIRSADTDGNPATDADPNWAPLGAPGGLHPDGVTVIPDFTPPFPAYVSGHATFGAAALHALGLYYGTDNIAFDLESVELPGVVRSFNTLSEAIAENGRSRVYLGIHWSYDDLEGQALGRAIADNLFAGDFISSAVIVPEPTALLIAAMGFVGVVRRR